VRGTRSQRRPGKRFQREWPCGAVHGEDVIGGGADEGFGDVVGEEGFFAERERLFEVKEESISGLPSARAVLAHRLKRSFREGETCFRRFASRSSRL